MELHYEFELFSIKPMKHFLLAQDTESLPPPIVPAQDKLYEPSSKVKDDGFEFEETYPFLEDMDIHPNFFDNDLILAPTWN